MSILPEIIIQNVLASGIRSARQDDEVLDMLFRNIQQDVVQNLKTSFRDMVVDVLFNYPREDSHFPCIAIVLRGEDESEAVIGELLGEGQSPGTIDGLAQAGTDARGTSGSRIREEFFYVPGNSEIEQSSVAAPEQVIIGSPRKMFVDDGTFYKREGSGYSANYMLHIFATKPEIVIFLYALTKFIIQRNRLTLERNGLFNLSISGTDFQPQPTHLPEYVYSRALSLGFLYWFDYVLTRGKAGSLGYGSADPTQVELNLCVTTDRLLDLSARTLNFNELLTVRGQEGQIHVIDTGATFQWHSLAGWVRPWIYSGLPAVEGRLLGDKDPADVDDWGFHTVGANAATTLEDGWIILTGGATDSVADTINTGVLRSRSNAWCQFTAKLDVAGNASIAATDAFHRSLVIRNDDAVIVLKHAVTTNNPRIALVGANANTVSPTQESTVLGTDEHNVEIYVWQDDQVWLFIDNEAVPSGKSEYSFFLSGPTNSTIFWDIGENATLRIKNVLLGGFTGTPPTL